MASGTRSGRKDQFHFYNTERSQRLRPEFSRTVTKTERFLQKLKEQTKVCLQTNLQTKIEVLPFVTFIYRSAELRSKSSVEISVFVAFVIFPCCELRF